MNLEPKKTEVAPFVRHIPQTEHVCPVCQKVFYAPRLRIYCSSDCKQKASWERNRDKFNERRRTKFGSDKAKKVKGTIDEKAQ